MGLPATNRMSSAICRTGFTPPASGSGAGSGVRIRQMAATETTHSTTAAMTALGAMNKETNRPPSAGPLIIAIELTLCSWEFPRAI